MIIPIKEAKIWKTGSGSAVVTIPSTYILNGQIQIGQRYNIEISTEKEVLEDGE